MTCAWHVLSYLSLEKEQLLAIYNFDVSLSQ